MAGSFRHDPSWYEDRFRDACNIVHARRMRDNSAKQEMQEIAARYNGSWHLSLKSVPGEPDFPAVAASLIGEAIDSFATRANDTDPIVDTPALRPNIEKSRDLAGRRRKAWGSAWEKSQLDLKMARAYRHLQGYGTYHFAVTPHGLSSSRDEDKYAAINTRNPLFSYPDETDFDEVRPPRNIGSIYARSTSQLIAKYRNTGRRDVVEWLEKHREGDDEMWDILEWQDEEVILVGLLGKRLTRSGATSDPSLYQGRFQQAKLLHVDDNWAGICTAICPFAVTLDRQQSPLDRIVPMADLLNKITALDYLAKERSVRPDTVIIGADDGSPPVLIGGQWHAGTTGKVNLVQNAKSIQELATAPGPMTQALQSNLERNARLSAGNPTTFQGEYTGSVRSGQQINQLAGMSVDPRLKEAHRIMGYTLEHVNVFVAEVEKAWFPHRKMVAFSGFIGDHEQFEYEPMEIWEETTRNKVEYPMPGMDSNNATIVLNELQTTGMMSRISARTRHPLIADADSEETAVLLQRLDDMALDSIPQMILQGALAFTDLYVIRDHVQSGMELGDAVKKAQEDAQERQATMAGPPGPEQVTAPEAQPGLNDPAAGGQQPAGPPPDAGGGAPPDIAALLGALGAAPG